MQSDMSKTKQRTIASLINLAIVGAVSTVLIILVANGGIKASNVDMIKFMGINVIAAVSLNMVTGLMGQLVLGHAGFMLVGAYATAMFVGALDGVSLWISLPLGLLVAGALSAVFGIAIGIPALRLRGDYLAIITLGFGEIIRVVANYLPFTNGAQGYSGYPAFSNRNQPAALFGIILVIAIFVVFFSYTFGTSRHGRAVLTIREDEIAAESSGINTTYYKLLTFALSAFFAGIAGGLLAEQIRIIDPATYGFSKSVDILMMVVLGGMGSITGAVIAAGVLTALPELLRTLGNVMSGILPAAVSDALGNFDQYRMLIYSIVLIIVMLFRPKGLLGRAEIRVLPIYKRLFGLGKKAAPKGGAGA